MTIRSTIIALGALATAAIAMLTLYDYMGFPKVAWAADISALKEENVKQGVDLYSIQLWKYLQFAPTTDDPMVRRQWQEIVKDKRRDLKVYEDRYIQLQTAK